MLHALSNQKREEGAQFHPILYLEGYKNTGSSGARWTPALEPLCLCVWCAVYGVLTLLNILTDTCH